MKVIRNRPIIQVILTDALMILLWRVYPSWWPLFSILIAFFTFMCFRTSNHVLLEGEEDGTTIIYTDSERKREPGHYITFNKENIISWDVQDDSNCFVVRYKDEHGAEMMSVINIDNLSPMKRYMRKTYPKQNVEHIEQEAVFDYLNKNRQSSDKNANDIQPEFLPVWIYHKIRDYLDPVKREEMKKKAAARKPLRDNTIDEYKPKQTARREAAEKQREKERAEREKKKAQEAAKEQKNTSTTNNTKKKKKK